MSKPWIAQYAPKKSADIPQQDAVKILTKYVDSYASQKKRAAILYGPAGSCKTCAVHAIARERGLEIVEVNASDARNAEQIETRIGEALKQRSLFSDGKIILIDEADGVSGTKDRGGIPALLKLIAESRFPLIITANDIWESKFSALRQKSLLIEFAPLSPMNVAQVLQRICDAETIRAEETAIKAIAARSGGDLRAAINDLQSLSHGRVLPLSRVDSLGDRDKAIAMKDALLRVFKTTDPLIALDALDNVDEDMDKRILWVAENLPHEYAGKDLARAYDALSRADVFRGRIRRQQHWRFLAYIAPLMTAGVAVAKDAKNPATVTYQEPSRILKLWIANQKWHKRKSIAEKIAPHIHASTRRTIQTLMPYLPALVKADSAMGNYLAEHLHLDEEEIEWLRK